LPRLSLTQAVATALENHPSLKRLVEEIEAAKAQEGVAASGFLPQITLEALGKEGPSSAPGFGFSGLANSTIVQNAGASLVLEQMIFDFGRTLHRFRASRFTTAAARAEQQAQQALVTLSVYRAYYRALLAERLVQLAEQDLAAREMVVKQAQAKAVAGLTSRVDVGLARTSLAEAQVGLIQARNARQSAYAELNQAMGVTGAPAYRLEEPPAVSSPSALSTSLDQDVALALTRRPEVGAAQSRIQSAGEQAQAAKAEGLPRLHALGSVGYLNAPEEFGDDRIFAVGIGLTFPLFTGGRVQEQVASARHEEGARRAAQDELAQGIRLEVIKARMLLNALLQSRPAIAEQLTQARDSVKLASQRYREGLGNILELQQAQLSLLTAETNTVRLRYDLITAQAAVRYALGTLVAAPKPSTTPGNFEPKGE
jgi:outer membrane protein